jgi:hypothetical protein
MDADWSVELGADDPALEIPWSSPDGSQRYIDLSQHIGAVLELPEVKQFPKLRDFLLEVNGRFSPWLSAKCHAWLDDELGEAEQIYGAKLKMCSYIDLIRRDESERFSFEQHEQWVKLATRKLHMLAQQAMACELIVRRCWYHPGSRAEDDPAPGLYVTVYVFGYGNDEAQATASWAGGLTRVSFVLGALRA